SGSLLARVTRPASSPPGAPWPRGSPRGGRWPRSSVPHGPSRHTRGSPVSLDAPGPEPRSRRHEGHPGLTEEESRERGHGFSHLPRPGGRGLHPAEPTADPSGG
uniref:Uncharacterized protein n=1 Tax=Cricetulus griseus TaxID=10029 RepID=A0A8C2M366_CRIGR